MPAGKVIFVRCGESQYSRDGHFTGWYDSHLTDNGKRQAVEVAAEKLRVKNIKLDYVYTSLLSRSIETADIILSEMEYPVMCIERDWRLNNRHYGELTSQKKECTIEIYGREKVRYWQRSFLGKPKPILVTNSLFGSIYNNLNLSGLPRQLFPLTESLRDVQERALKAWEGSIFPMVKDGKIVLVVTHGAVIRVFRQYFEHMSEDVFMETNIAHCVPHIYNFTQTGVHGKLKISLNILAFKDYTQGITYEF